MSDSRDEKVDEKVDENRWIQVRRVGVFSTIQMGFFVGVAYALLLFIAGILVDELYLEALFVAVALPIAAFVAVIVFNVVCPFTGGLLLEVRDHKLLEPATKRCPSCGKEVMERRTFCPSCDHDFAPARNADRQTNMGQ